MINNKKELVFYIFADRIMNGYPAKKDIKEIVLRHLYGGGKIEYLEAMRKYSYYQQVHGIIAKIRSLYWGVVFRRLGTKLGFSIGEHVFGYGLVIPHYGTIVVGVNNRIGNFAVLHTSTCISDKKTVIGEGLYLSTGAKITKHVVLGDGVTIAANSVVNRSFGNNTLVVGAPAIEKDVRPIWYSCDEKYIKRVEEIKNHLDVE